MSTRPSLEVADVIRAHGNEFLASHGASLSAGQKRVLTALVKCRTAALGGHVEECLDCGHVRIAYNSCRNRHCPKCQGAKRAAWLEREAGYLLPVEYHHVVFTLPQELAALALQNQTVVYAKPPFGGPDQVLKYLARYTHRVAVSNHRLEGLADGQVRFRYKDYAHAGRQRTLTLAVAEFLRRFLLHVLPRGFVKVRHYGLLANRQRQQKLACCRPLLAAVAAVLLLGQVGAAVRPADSGCQRCGSAALRRQEISPAEAVSLSVQVVCPHDTS